MPILSVIMPVKDGESYIEAAVRSLQSQSLRDWELVVVDDHSADRTASVVRALGGTDDRIALVDSPGHGKVQAVNTGYGRCRGEFLKVVDADDLVAPEFSEAFGRLRAAGASYHDATLLDDRTGGRTRIHIGRRFQEMSLERSLRRIRISPPFWSWTLARDVAARVFPLPADVPFPHEDVFFGLAVKKAARVEYVPRPLYVYRQHAGQAYGGLFDHSAEVTRRRARAMLAIIDAVGRSELVRGFEDPDALLAASKAYFLLMSRDRVTWAEILRARLGPVEKARLAVLRKAPALASWLSRRRAVGRSRAGRSEKER